MSGGLKKAEKRLEEKKPKLLHNKNFILLFLGEFVSRIGSNIHYVAVTWFVLELTGSGSKTGLLLFLTTLPGVFIGPFGGVIADRINRKFLIVSMDIIRGIFVLWLSWAVYTDVANFTYLSIVTVLVAASSAFFNPAVGAARPSIVDDRNLQQANSFNQFSMKFSAIIGAALGGVLIAVFGIAGVFMLNGISFLLSAFSEMFINIPKVEKSSDEKENSMLQDFKTGAKFLFNNKSLYHLVLVTLVLNFLTTGVLMVGLPYVFKEILNSSSNLYGIAQAIFPIGSVIGAIILGSRSEVKSFYKTLCITIGVQTVVLAALAIPIMPIVMLRISNMGSYYSLLVLLLIAGTFNALVNIPFSVLLQRFVPNDIRGRVFGLFGTFNQGLVPISMALMGWLLDTVPAYYIFMVSGIAQGLFILYSFRKPSIKNVDKNLNSKNISNGHVAAQTTTQSAGQ